MSHAVSEPAVADLEQGAARTSTDSSEPHVAARDDDAGLVGQIVELSHRISSSLLTQQSHHPSSGAEPTIEEEGGADVEKPPVDSEAIAVDIDRPATNMATLVSRPGDNDRTIGIGFNLNEHGQMVVDRVDARGLGDRTGFQLGDIILTHEEAWFVICCVRSKIAKSSNQTLKLGSTNC